MRVLYILSQKPGNTGSGIYLKYITREALKHGIDLRVVVGITEHSDLENISHIPEDKIYPVYFGKHTKFTIAGMSDVMPYESIKFSSFNEKMFKDYIDVFANVFNKVRYNWEPDIVHSNHLWIATALAIKIFDNVPVIASCHGTALRQSVLAPFIEKKIYSDLQKISCVLALTEEQKAKIINWLKLDSKKVIVTGSGYANDIFCPVEKKFKHRNYFKIIYAGKVSFSKGVPCLISAFKKLNPKFSSKTFLYIAGDFNNIEAMQIMKLAESSKNIIFLGKLSQEQLAEKFRDSHLFILPSFFEGLPLVVIESLACGCAAIVTKLPDIEAWIHRDLIENGVIKLVPLPRLKSIDEPVDSDIEGFIDKLKDSIEHYAESFFKNKFPDTLKFFNYISEHSFENLFKKIFKIYQRFII